MSFIKVASRWISLYLLNFIIIASFFPVFLMRSPDVFERVDVDNNVSKWDSSIDPVWVAQMSDLHVSPIYDVSLNRVNETFHYIAKNVNPMFLLLTGDLTDNLDTRSVWSPAYPHEEHFKLFQSMRDSVNISRDRIVEILGNHDTWGRENFPERYMKYFINSDLLKKNFYVQKYIRKNVKIIAFQPIHFPTGHTTFLFVVPIYREMLDALEDALDEVDENDETNITIFSMHFTTGMMFPIERVRSTRTHRTMKEILSDPKYHIYSMITGHTHPRKSGDWIHYGKTIEFTSTALLDEDGFAIFSVDNHRINYKTYYQNQTKLAILTAPGPNQIATRIFNDSDFQIRVVALTPNANNFVVSGDIEGKLTFQRELEGGSSLYALDVHDMKPGNYSIMISGDLNESCNFSVGVPIGPLIEFKEVDLLGWVMVLYFIILSVYQIIILIVTLLPRNCLSSFDTFFEWLNDEKSTKCNNYLIKVFLGGPFTIGCFLRRLKFPLKAYSLFLSVSPFVMPIGIYLIEGKIGFYTTFGVSLGWKHTYDVCSQMFGLFYEGYVLAASHNLLILLLFKPQKSMIFDVIYNLLLFAGGITHWRFYGTDKAMPILYRITLYYHIIPVFSILVFLTCLSKKFVSSSTTEKKEKTQ